MQCKHNKNSLRTKLQFLRIFKMVTEMVDCVTLLTFLPATLAHFFSHFMVTGFSESAQRRVSNALKPRMVFPTLLFPEPVQPSSTSLNSLSKHRDRETSSDYTQCFTSTLKTKQIRCTCGAVF